MDLCDPESKLLAAVSFVMTKGRISFLYGRTASRTMRSEGSRSFVNEHGDGWWSWVGKDVELGRASSTSIN
jgi:hypothetical protein